MRVQRVLMPGSRFESWTVLGDDHVPVEPVERFLGYLSSIERSPNTVKAYAHDLKDWFTFLAGRDRDWRAATLEDVAGFVAWLRLPPAGRDGRVQVLPSVAHQCAASSVNRKLAALTSFCEFHARRPLGHPLTYPAVHDLVGRLRRRTGVEFSPHWFRHTYATWLLRRGAGMESVKELLGHASITTTVDTYGHLSVEDARATLEAAGWFTGTEVRW
jgi:site-specific recombinase XerD